MSFYHGPGDSQGCFSTKGRTLHFGHGPKYSWRDGHKSSLSGMISWSFDHDFEFVWSIWPIQVYFRIRPLKAGFPIIIDFRNLIKARREIRQVLWETNGFGFDQIARRTYLVTEAYSIGVRPETFMNWYKPPRTIEFGPDEGKVASEEKVV